MTSLAQNFFLALMRAVWGISRPRSARDRKWNGQPQDPGFQTEPGAPFAEGEERRGPSTAQPNHLTGSEMGREKLGGSGRVDRGGLTHPPTGREERPLPPATQPSHRQRDRK